MLPPNFPPLLARCCRCCCCCCPCFWCRGGARREPLLLLLLLLLLLQEPRATLPLRRRERRTCYASTERKAKTVKKSPRKPEKSEKKTHHKHENDRATSNRDRWKAEILSLEAISGMPPRYPRTISLDEFSADEVPMPLVLEHECRAFLADTFNDETMILFHSSKNLEGYFRIGCSCFASAPFVLCAGRPRVNRQLMCVYSYFKNT